MEGYRPGNVELGMCQQWRPGDAGLQALLVPSCPSPSFMGRGSSSWEIPVPPSSLSFPGSWEQSRGAARCHPSGLKGRNTRWAFFPFTPGGSGQGYRRDPVPAGQGIQGRARCRHHLGSIRMSELTLPGIPEGRGCETPLSPGEGCCGQEEAEEGKGTSLIVASQCTEGKGNRSFHAGGEPCCPARCSRSGNVSALLSPLSFLFLSPLAFPWGKGELRAPSGTAQDAPTRPARAGLTNQPEQD